MEKKKTQHIRNFTLHTRFHDERIQSPNHLTHTHTRTFPFHHVYCKTYAILSQCVTTPWWDEGCLLSLLLPGSHLEKENGKRGKARDRFMKQKTWDGLLQISLLTSEFMRGWISWSRKWLMFVSDQFLKKSSLNLKGNISNMIFFSQDPVVMTCSVRSHKALAAPLMLSVKFCREFIWTLVVYWIPRTSCGGGSHDAELLCRFHQFAGLHNYFHDDTVAASALCNRPSCCDRRNHRFMST